MKRYMKFIVFAVFVGCLIAFLFYQNINQEVRAIAKKEEIINLFQVGVFKNEGNAHKFAKTFESSLVYQDNEYYRVIIAISYHKEVSAKLEALYKGKELNYYIKEYRVNKDFIKKIDSFEKILLKSNNEDVIYNVNNSILSLFDSYIH